MDIILRASAIYVLLWAVTRGMGKRELAEMSPFELIVLVIMGDLIQQGVTQNDRSITGAALAILTMTFWVVVISWLTFKSRKAAELFEGVPVVVIRDGRPVDKALRYEHIDLSDVEGEARGQGISDLAKVRVGVLEPDGSFSFVLYDGPGPQQTTPPRSLD